MLRRQASDWQHEIYRHKLSTVAARRPTGNAKTWQADGRRSFAGNEALGTRYDWHALLLTLLCETYSWCMLAGRRATQRRGRGSGVPVTCETREVWDAQRTPAGQARRLRSTNMPFQNLSAEG